MGDNREVWCANTNSTVQRTQYYPSGLPIAYNPDDNPSLQKRKYNGKEFVEMHGYDTYDYGARGMYPAIGSFATVDPLAEKYYGISPYAYCAGNPVNAIDPDGKDPRKIGDWWKFAKAVYNASTAVITVGFQGAISGKVGDISVGVNSNAGSFDLVGIRSGNFTPNKNAPFKQKGGEFSIGVVSFSTNTTKTDNGKTTTVEKKDAASFLFVAEKSRTTTTEIDNTSKQTLKSGSQSDLKVPDISIKVGLIVVPEIGVNTEKVATAINDLLNK